MWPPEKQLGIPDYALDLCHEVERRTGKPIRITEVIQPYEFDSEMRFARSNEETHVLAYRGEYRTYRDHFLVGGCLKVLRLWEEPEERRYMPALARGRLPRDQHRQLLERAPPFMPEVELEALSAFMNHGILGHLVSLPVDLRVERELAAEYPQHRDRQRAYLARQVGDLVPHFAPEVGAFAPDACYQATSALNIVLGMEASELSGTPEHSCFRTSKHRPLGERLHAELHGVAVPGREGDRLLTDRWARILGLRHGYQWVSWARADGGGAQPPTP
ncbi:MAG: hypothetical protein L6R43_00550 [Planctomycetes bacterium]|nr:hypothetical protein [Planctomycetota bacterium]